MWEQVFMYSVDTQENELINEYVTFDSPPYFRGAG